jgi:glyoxylase-like metal-dependent hydrolase (beta-lactamase superfamily II)
MVECLYTPGHTPGCQCFLVEGNLFTGDTLFIDAVGRTDFPGGSGRALLKSLQRIKQLPDNTMIWPGHHYGEPAHEELGVLKLTNPYLIDNSENAVLD